MVEVIVAIDTDMNEYEWIHKMEDVNGEINTL